MLAVVQSSGSVLLSIVCWKKCAIIGVNEQTDIFILDFEKAFDTDTVPHEQLKAKLYRYGILTGKTLMWIDSFLCYRKQCVHVVVNGTKSKWSDVESGVIWILLVGIQSQCGVSFF
jgi:hypothetical protein